MMGSRRTWVALAGGAVAVAAGVARFADSGGIASSAKAAGAGLLAAAVIGLALSLWPQVDPRGLVIGGFFVSAGVLSWTFTDRPLVVWGVLLVEGLVFIAWSWPWLRGLRPATRLGTAWLGVAYWLLGIVGALLVAHWRIAAERVAYAGVFGLAVLAVLARSRIRDLSAGVAAAFLLALGLLLLAGSGNLFEATHAVPDNDWGKGFEYRFWGGEWLLYHPNSMAAMAAVAAVRVGVDRAFAVWQRLAGIALAGFILVLTNSRTGFVMLAAAAVGHAALLLWRRARSRAAEVPDYGTPTRVLAAVATPFVALALVLAVAGPSFLGQNRYAEGGVTSGRMDTWKQVFVEWRDASVAEKVFGDAKTTRAVVKRASSGDDIQLTTDNAAVGALRRGGALGVAAFLLGLGLLLWHAGRRGAPAWFPIAVLSAMPAMATSDALLGGTGGTVWVLLLAGEAWLLFGTRQTAPALQRPAEHLTRSSH